MTFIESWHADEDKCKTFDAVHIFLLRLRSIILCPVTFIILERSKDGSSLIPDDLTQGMVGDVNLFLTDVEGDEEEEEGDIERTNTPRDSRKQGELEIMIAEPAARRKGYARQALNLMICYAMKQLQLGPEDFIVRIGIENPKSIQLFEKMGFEITKKVEIFQEVEMRVKRRVEHFKWLMESEKLSEVELTMS